MNNPNHICAIIDAQGFFVQNKFYPREVSIVNDEYQLCFEIIPNISLDTKLNCYSQFSFQQKKLHGIPLSQVLPNTSKNVFEIRYLKNIIEYIYMSIRNEKKFLLGVKNTQLKNMLEEYRIPLYNFEQEEVCGEICPPLAVFEKFKNSIYCSLHAKLVQKKDETTHRCPIGIQAKYHERRPRCALRKAWVTWDWLKHKLSSDILFDNIIARNELAREHFSI